MKKNILFILLLFFITTILIVLFSCQQPESKPKKKSKEDNNDSGTIMVVTFSPPDGTYTTAQNVTISTITSGVTIRYTIDGSIPTSSYGTIYLSPINISRTTTLNAIAYKKDWTDSPVSSANYIYTINYKLVTVPAITNFPMGYAGVLEPVHTVPSISSFKMGTYEVTYDQWYTIRQWAITNGYTFANKGTDGNDGIAGDAPTTTKNEPVAWINWRDCIVWCNAASQYEGLTPVYYSDSGFTTILKTSTNANSINATAGSEDNPYVNWSVNGYRLPTEAEWEACARYQNGTTWLRGDAPSGWVDNMPADGNWRVEAGVNWLEDGLFDNYIEVSHVAWWASIITGTQNIGKKAANNLTLYDMPGNIAEWCWDWNGAYTTSSPYTDSNPKGPTTGNARIYRGGSWFNDAYFLQSCMRQAVGPSSESDTVGLRICRTK